MTHKIAGSIVAVLCCVLPASGGEQAALLLHLPRAVTIQGEKIELSHIGVLRGDDAALVRKASAIAMGRAPWSGEKIVIDRRTIVSRLALAGIEARTVRITGAEKVAVTRNEKIIDVAELTQSAQAFLTGARQAPAGHTWRPVGRPAALVISGGEDVSLKPRLGKGTTKDSVRVEIAAVHDGRELGKAVVRFVLMYPAKKIVATRRIASGEAITKDNVRIEEAQSEHEAGEWKSPYGMLAGIAVDAGSVIRPSLLKHRQTQILVRRNQTVQMRIEGAGFVITAMGKALTDGRAGEIIRVQNVDSKKIVTVRVTFDGTVEPIHESR
jgi:flagellar basal body P-ring formation protein FlgA